MNDTLVITHSADLDGQCSQAIARRALGDKADYLPWDYGQPIPDLAPYSTVYLIDISLPPEVMRTNAGKLCWLDHHRTAIEAMKDTFIDGYRIDGVAAARLAWQWFNGAPGGLRVDHVWPAKADYVERRVTEPYAVQLLGEYDIWDKRNPDTDLFQLGMQAEKSPPWDDLFRETGEGIRPFQFTRAIVERGRAIQSYLDVTNAQIATDRGFDVCWEGLYWRALCTARCNSLTFTAALRPEHDGCLAYHWNGRAWRFSLYHAPGKEHHNLSLISAKHGGGGHPGASGFQLDRLPSELGGFRFKDSDFAGRL